MHLHSQTWGHVSYAGISPKELELAEEENELRMLRARYGSPGFSRSNTSLCSSVLQKDFDI